MANSQEIIRYKQQLTSLIINNAAVVKLINEPEITNPEDLIYHNIYDFVRIPETIDEEKTYICIKVDVPQVYRSSFLFKQLIISIYIISHQKQMITEYGGTRIDLISALLDKMLNGRRDIGKKKLELISNIEDSIGSKHRCRIMKFKAEDINNSKCFEPEDEILDQLTE